MIGLDTNVLVRFCVQDDPMQSPKANALFSTLSRENPGFITKVALVELIGVLSSNYGRDRAALAEIMKRLLSARELRFEDWDVCREAFHLFRDSKADFADCLIETSCRAGGCDYSMSFDVAAVKHAGFRLLK